MYIDSEEKRVIKININNQIFLKAMTEAPAVGTACNPVLKVLDAHFGEGYERYFASDAFCIYWRKDTRVEDIEAVFIAHLDEVGGNVLSEQAKDSGAFLTSVWGNLPTIYKGELQAFDYLAETGEEAFPVTGTVELVEEEPRLILRGEGIRPFRTVFTFREETTFKGDVIEGKALDPRVTTAAVAKAVTLLNSSINSGTHSSKHSGKVAAVFVMAEERCMDVAKKAVTYLQRHAPNLKLVVNADVPGIQNLTEGQLEMPAIRIFEGRNFIDPMFGIRMSEKLEAKGVEFHLTASRSGSQTLLFTPLAPTISVALPSEGVHLPRVKMSLLGYERCIKLLTSIGEEALSD